MFELKLDILPAPQRRLWAELGQTPDHFILYGGTALALRLGHRQSVDFDFFSSRPFVPSALQSQIPYLRQAQLIRSSPNTLTCRVDRGGSVLVSFFGGLPIKQAAAPDEVPGTTIRVASLLDLAATKVKVILDRASAKDYVDIDAILMVGVSLAHALAAAQVVYGPSFDPLLSLKALSYFGDGDVTQLPQNIRGRLTQAVREIDIARIPLIETAHDADNKENKGDAAT